MRKQFKSSTFSSTDFFQDSKAKVKILTILNTDIAHNDADASILSCLSKPYDPSA